MECFGGNAGCELCVHCGMEVGTEVHHIWQCRLLKSFALDAVANTAHLSPGMDVSPVSFWGRAVPPIGLSGVPAPEEQSFVVDLGIPDGTVPFAVGTDGSGGMHGSDTMLRRVGFWLGCTGIG